MGVAYDIGGRGAALVFEKERACFSPGVPPGRTTGPASVLMVSQLAPGQQQEGPRDTLDPDFFI